MFLLLFICRQGWTAW